MKAIIHYFLQSENIGIYAVREDQRLISTLLINLLEIVEANDGGIGCGTHSYPGVSQFKNFLYQYTARCCYLLLEHELELKNQSLKDSGDISFSTNRNPYYNYKSKTLIQKYLHCLHGYDREETSDYLIAELWLTSLINELNNSFEAALKCLEEIKLFFSATGMSQHFNSYLQIEIEISDIESRIKSIESALSLTSIAEILEQKYEVISILSELFINVPRTARANEFFKSSSVKRQLELIGYLRTSYLKANDTKNAWICQCLYFCKFVESANDSELIIDNWMKEVS